MGAVFGSLKTAEYFSFCKTLIYAICPKIPCQFGKFSPQNSRPNFPIPCPQTLKTLSAKMFPVAVCVSLKMYVSVEILDSFKKRNPVKPSQPKN